MTAFEQFLISKGYIKYRYEYNRKKDFSYFVKEKEGRHFLSSMGNIDYRYYHYTDPIVKKIENGELITREDRVNEICFGLHECGKPPTLIYPRHMIKERYEPYKDGYLIYPPSDDDINRLLLEEDFEDILKAIYDKSIIFALRGKGTGIKAQDATGKA